jgi:secreted trypsin-like serine protease
MGRIIACRVVVVLILSALFCGGSSSSSNYQRGSIRRKDRNRDRNERVVHNKRLLNDDGNITVTGTSRIIEGTQASEGEFPYFGKIFSFFESIPTS